MSIEELGVRQSDFSYSGILYCEIRPTNIWILRDDSILIVIDRKNVSNFQRYQFNCEEPSLATLVVDDIGEQCVILWKRYPFLTFSIRTKTFKQNRPPRGVMPSAACWVTIPRLPPSILIGSSQGQVLLLTPNTNNPISFLYVPKDPCDITEIQAIEGEISAVFLFVVDKVLCFSGNQSIQNAFGKGPSNRILFLGNLQRPIFPRIIASKTKKGCELASLVEFGVLLYTASTTSQNAINFQQDIIEVSTKDAKGFERCEWGTFIIYENDVRFVTASKTKITLPIKGVRKISTNGSSIALVTSEKIIEIPIASFQRTIARIAVDQNDLVYAFSVAKDDAMQRDILRRISDKKSPDAAASLLCTVQLPFEKKVTTCGIESNVTLLYFKKAFAETKNPKKKAAFAEWVVHIHCCFLPERQSELLGFLDSSYKYLDINNLYKRFEELNFWEGISHVAVLTGNSQKVLDSSIAQGKYDEAISALQKLQNMPVLDTLSRIPTEKYDNFLDTLGSSISPADIMPVLASMSRNAAKFIADTSASSNEEVLLIISLCATKNEERIFHLMKEKKYDPVFVYRFAELFGCEKTRSRCLIEIGRVQEAVTSAVNVGRAFAISIVESIEQRQMKKEAYLVLFKLIKDNSELIFYALASGLFEFEELIEVIGDEEFIYSFGEELMTSADSITNNSQLESFSGNINIKEKTGIQICQDDCCCICSKPLFGKHFVGFPCHHEAHSECLESIKSTKESCPVCGFYSIQKATKPFISAVSDE